MAGMFVITYRSTGPVPDYQPTSDHVGYMGVYETDDPLIFADVLEEIEEFGHLTLISVEYDGKEVPVFGPYPGV